MRQVRMEQRRTIVDGNNLKTQGNLSDIWGISNWPPDITTVMRVAHSEIFYLETKKSEKKKLND